MNHEKHEKTRKKKRTTEYTENTQPSPKAMAGAAEVGFGGLVGLFEQTQTAMQTQAAKSVDTALVVRNWLFGWYIVEFEQKGSDRAKYGKQLLKELASQLSIKGCSERNLASFRKFHLTYADILQAVPAKSSKQKQIQQTVPVTSSDIGHPLPDQCFQLIGNSNILQAMTAKLSECFARKCQHLCIRIPVVSSG